MLHRVLIYGGSMRADRVKRREFITLLGSAAAAWPLVARAQSPRPRPLIAWLSGGAPANSQFATEAFLQGMRDLGYIEGRAGSAGIAQGSTKISSRTFTHQPRRMKKPDNSSAPNIFRFTPMTR
jgi:hypothetical protein